MDISLACLRGGIELSFDFFQTGVLQALSGRPVRIDQNHSSQVLECLHPGPNTREMPTPQQSQDLPNRGTFTSMRMFACVGYVCVRHKHMRNAGRYVPVLAVELCKCLNICWPFRITICQLFICTNDLFLHRNI